MPAPAPRRVRSKIMRILAIDFGEKRIGLALSDPDGRFALPLDTLERRDDHGAVARILEIVRREGVELLVVGDPVLADGSRTGAAQRVDGFARRLGAASGLPLHRVAETLTSVEAEARLRRAGIDPRRRPGRVDQVAAQILLEEFLARPGDPGP